MKDHICDEFQDAVADCLVRHKSIIDVITKLQESSSRVGRATSKAVTSCGCLEINAKKQQFPDEIRLHELASHMDTHIKGKLCTECREVMEQELGNHLFYLAALCNVLGLSLHDVLSLEQDKLLTLGVYTMA